MQRKRFTVEQIINHLREAEVLLSAGQERTLHGIFRLKKKNVPGAGAEWFIATIDEVIDAYNKIVS